MNISNYTFVALDLETTGLSTDTDTIIEIAAIRFTLQIEGDIFVIQNSLEKSMLINPGRILEQEVTMITGITSDMLIGKPTFDIVRDKVHDFIGDAIIVGHNVLFDIAMLANHGIDIQKNIIIDTFELSEIFSQDIESLNLGFLATHYGLIDPNETEHRALTDTKISIRLLLRYLSEIRHISGKKKQIWDSLISKDESQTLQVLSHICHLIHEVEGDMSMIFGELLRNPDRVLDKKNIPTGVIKNTDKEKILIDTHGNIQEEIALIKNVFKSHTHINLVVPGYKVANWMSQVLQKSGIENMVTIPTKKWCSVEYMRELLLDKKIYSRKKVILILKLAFWMTETKTGLIDELKFYGDERNMIDIFYSREQDSSIWQEQYEAKIKVVPVIITDAYSIQLGNQDTKRYTIMKDITLLEDIIRRVKSQEISFDKLYESIETLNPDNAAIDQKIHMADMISMIRGIYESIPTRPTGPLVSPPGAYGETYCITQQTLWHQGHRWLIHATHALNQSWKIWKEGQKISLSRKEKISMEYIESAIQRFIQYHTFTETNVSVILNILDEKTKIIFIPRSVKTTMEPILRGSIGYGTNLSLSKTGTFLKNEYGYSIDDINSRLIQTMSRQIAIFTQYHPGIIQPGTVVLTTSQKHARDLGKELRKIHGKTAEVLIQGLSGGKGKMLSIFKNNTDQVILVGIIDTWRDEYDLWASAQHIIIAKLPFDPPTDTYFLARTIGMSNNFSEYSEPLVIIRINILIERVLSSGYVGKINISDSRLIDTEWGKKLYKELL